MKLKLSPCPVAVLMFLAGCASSGSPTPPAASLAAAAERSSWRSPYGTGEKITTHHYRIYTTVGSRSLLRHLPGFMEAAYENYLELTKLSDLPSTQPMPVYMLGGRREWAELTKKVIGRNADKYLAIQAGGYCYQGVCVFWDIGSVPTLSVASHEGLHQFLHHRMKHRLPLWLEEGLCVTAEGFEINGDAVRFTPNRNVSRFSNLRQAIVTGHWIPLKQLLPMDGGDAVKRPVEEAVGYYGQLWALAMFIRSRDEYAAGIQRMLVDAEAGKLHEALKLSPEAIKALLRRGRLYNHAVSERLFRHYVSNDLGGFDRQFYEFASQLAQLL